MNKHEFNLRILKWSEDYHISDEAVDALMSIVNRAEEEATQPPRDFVHPKWEKEL